MNIEPDKVFAALSHAIRLRCILLLAREGELCVCELTHALDMAQPTISRHLALLREAGLVSDRRQGLWIYYRLHPDLPAWVSGVIETTVKGVGGEEPYAGDHAALTDMPNRPGAPCCA